MFSFEEYIFETFAYSFINAKISDVLDCTLIPSGMLTPLTSRDHHPHSIRNNVTKYM